MTAEAISHTGTRTSQTLNELVAAEVRATMGRFGLKQKDLSKILEVSQTQVSSRLRGATPFSLDDIEVIANWFSTTPQVLMGFASEPRPQNPAYKKFLAADAARNSDSYTAWDSNPEPIDYESANEVAWQNLVIATLLIVSVATRILNQQTI